MRVQVTLSKTLFWGNFPVPEETQTFTEMLYLDTARLPAINPEEIELACKKILTSRLRKRGAYWVEKVGNGSRIERNLEDWEIKE